MHLIYGKKFAFFSGKGHQSLHINNYTRHKMLISYVKLDPINYGNIATEEILLPVGYDVALP